MMALPRTNKSTFEAVDPCYVVFECSSMPNRGYFDELAEHLQLPTTMSCCAATRRRVGILRQRECFDAAGSVQVFI